MPMHFVSKATFIAYIDSKWHSYIVDSVSIVNTCIGSLKADWLLWTNQPIRFQGSIEVTDSEYTIHDKQTEKK